MTKRTIGECLKEYREEADLSVPEVVSLTSHKVSVANITRIERGLVANPGYVTLCTILEAYGKNPCDLTQDMMKKGTEKKSFHADVINIRRAKFNSRYVPIIELIECKNYVKGENVNTHGKVVVSKKVSAQAFAVKVTNDVMMSNTQITYPEGCIVIFDPECQLHNNRDGIVELDGQYLFRRIVKDAGTTYLKTLNNNYPNQEHTGDVATIAPAIEARITTL